MLICWYSMSGACVNIYYRLLLYVYLVLMCACTVSCVCENCLSPFVCSTVQLSKPFINTSQSCINRHSARCLYYSAS